MVRTTMKSRLFDIDPAARRAIIARIIHDAVYAVNHDIEGRGDYPRWEDRSDVDRQMYIDALVKVMADKTMTPERLHGVWMESKIADGWTYGPTRDYIRKTHPSIVSYDRLSTLEQAKDILFLNMVRALEPLL